MCNSVTSIQTIIFYSIFSIQTMSYFSRLQNSRWTHVGGTSSYFTISFGSRGLNGVCVHNLTKKSQSDIVKWFECKSIRLVKNVPEDGLWWSFEQYSNQYTTGNKEEIMYEGGYTFKMGKEAHERMFPNRK